MARTASALDRISGPAALAARARAWLADGGVAGAARRMAGATFLIRVASAAILYLSQVLLARWMGAHEFGLYVYVWTWVVLLGSLTALGLGTAAQRFVPAYRDTGARDLLRGFVHGGRWIAFGLGLAAAVLALGAVHLLTPVLDKDLILPLVIAAACVPLMAVGDVQYGIGCSYDWTGVAALPGYVLRPILVLAAMAGFHAAGLPATAVSAMLAVLGATAATTLLQLLVLNRRIGPQIAGVSSRHAVGDWFGVALPLFMVESFFLLLTTVDILVLERFQPAQDVAVYYAAVKTLALVSFVHFAVTAAAAHRFAGYHAAGDRAGLIAFLGETVRLTFWPSLAAVAALLAVGKPVLALFGAGFEAGYPLLFILSIGLVARGAVGPIERLLTMSGEQRVCALVYAGAFAFNLIANIVLVPRFGLVGAASATACAMVIEALALFQVARRRLGVPLDVWRPIARRPGP